MDYIALCIVMPCYFEADLMHTMDMYIYIYTYVYINIYIYIYIFIYIYILDVQMGAKAPICTRLLRSLLKARMSELKLRTSELKPRISELKPS